MTAMSTYSGNMTLAERERSAYLHADTAALSMLYASEEDSAESVSSDHEAVIDDRNRLREALEECAARMGEAVTQLDDLDIREPYDYAPAFLDAIEDARSAIARCESQSGDTPTDKLHKLQDKYDAAVVRIGTLRTAQRQAHEAADTMRYIVAPYVGQNAKPAPKWAKHVIQVLARMGGAP